MLYGHSVGVDCLNNAHVLFVPAKTFLDHRLLSLDIYRDIYLYLPQNNRWVMEISTRNVGSLRFGASKTSTIR